MRPAWHSCGQATGPIAHGVSPVVRPRKLVAHWLLLLQAASYAPDTQLTKLPLYLIKEGRRADCWQVTGVNYGCFLQFDLGGTPRIVRPLTPTVQSGAWGEI